MFTQVILVSLFVSFDNLLTYFINCSTETV